LRGPRNVGTTYDLRASYRLPNPRPRKASRRDSVFRYCSDALTQDRQPLGLKCQFCARVIRDKQQSATHMSKHTFSCKKATIHARHEVWSDCHALRSSKPSLIESEDPCESALSLKVGSTSWKRESTSAGVGVPRGQSHHIALYAGLVNLGDWRPRRLNYVKEPHRTRQN
jgi:hypothetical protein